MMLIAKPIVDFGLVKKACNATTAHYTEVANTKKNPSQIE